MSAFVLKLIAIVSMLIDHTAHIFQTEITAVSPWLYIALRAVGRLAFPLFAFGVAEGASKTHSGKKYLIRMLVFAMISQIPFSLMLGVRVPDLSFKLFGRAIGFSTEMSVMVTLFLGLALCLSLKENRPLAAAAVLAFAYLADITVGMDYGFLGVLFVLALYYAKRSKPGLIAVILIFSAAVHSGTLISAAKLILGRGGIKPSSIVMGLVYIAATALAAIPVMLYNGKRGPKTGIWAYLVYPVHMAALCVTYYLIH